MYEVHRCQLERTILACLEDGVDDSSWSTDLCVKKDQFITAKVKNMSETIVSGIEVARSVFNNLDSHIDIVQFCENGKFLRAESDLITLHGPAQAILRAESLVLSFLTRLSGIAYTTFIYVNGLESYKTKLLNSRNVTPWLRLVETSALQTGGAKSRKLFFTNGVFLSQNHISLAGGITSAINLLEESLSPTQKIEVMVSSLKEVHEALDAGADLIVLKGMSIAEIRMAVRTVQERAFLEVTGDLSIEEVKQIGETGVDFVSTDSILKSPYLVNLKLELVESST